MPNSSRAESRTVIHFGFDQVFSRTLCFSKNLQVCDVLLSRYKPILNILQRLARGKRIVSESGYGSVRFHLERNIED
jgi:hypothetical protein